MRSEDWEFSPLSPGAPFPLGGSPFRARGGTFVGVLQYVERRLPGGMEALKRALSGDPFARYFEQIFVMNGDYDAAALLRLFLAVAELERIPAGKFIVQRCRATADLDVRGIYRLLLDKPSPAKVAERLPFAFGRYFSPCLAQAVAVEPRKFECELSKVPESMTGLYTNASTGFVGRCLELAGAASVRFRWEAQAPHGQLAGVRTVRAGFTAEW